MIGLVFKLLEKNKFGILVYESVSFDLKQCDSIPQILIFRALS